MAHFNSFQIHIGIVLLQTVLLEMRERMRYKIKSSVNVFIKRKIHLLSPI